MQKIIPILATLASVPALAKTCNLDIDGTDQMKYSKAELTVEKGCTEVKLTLKHAGKLQKNIMGHNWVLAKAADVDGLAAEGIKAGPSKDYLPAGDKRLIANTGLVGGGEVSTVTFKTSGLKAGESYVYFCTFPGHASMMKGKLIVK